MGLVLKYVDEPDVQELVKLLIDQAATFMLNTNFLGLDYHGGTTGVQQRAFFLQGGVWTLLLLKIATLAYPEKYQRYYDQRFIPFKHRSG